ncbi:Hypothetical protein A7982_00352 [Minicystis rosea]|nr:Hypothetical protein A7982_00352 [Minicystis rosea]
MEVEIDRTFTARLRERCTPSGVQPILKRAAERPGLRKSANHSGFPGRFAVRRRRAGSRKARWKEAAAGTRAEDPVKDEA